MVTFEIIGGYKASGKLVYRGPKGIVVGDYYREIWLVQPNGQYAKHSHGYTGDGWMPYFESVCGR